jgi:hypothetical protein
MILTILGLLTATVPQAASDPLAPAREGKIQCHSPDLAHKTCLSIARYEPRADGSYLNTADLLLDPQYAVSLRVRSEVRVKGPAICGVLTRDDILGGEVEVAGAAMPDKTKPILERVAAAFESMGLIGKEICTSYSADGGQLRAEAKVDGVVRPEFAQPVIWVGPDDGWTLGAPQKAETTR